MKKVAIWVGVIVIITASIWGLIALVNSPAPTSSISNLPPVSKDDIATGPKDAKVTLVEYADFQCPACAAYHPLVKQLLSDFPKDIYFVYRFFPLTSIHQNALLSSQAGFAANLQGKFWQMHDMIYENQKSWATQGNAMEIFTSYATKINLDVEKFKKDINSDETKKFVNDELNQGISIGVNSTPTFFINGKKIQNPNSYDEFKKLVQDQIK
ncbi:MAG: thioredoxin domain-containing protein [Candidatus Levybacteria bacterium]|nr:thioredoxin domain-containing protein [Candidatus Levybacteria bacterium]